MKLHEIKIFYNAKDLVQRTKDKTQKKIFAKYVLPENNFHSKYTKNSKTRPINKFQDRHLAYR